MKQLLLGTGVEVGVSCTGSGPTVLLLGGLGMPAIVWEMSGLVEQLVSAGFQVVFYNARGIPPSSAPPAPYSVGDLADDALGVLDQLDTSSDVIVVGYSLGTFTAQELLKKRPDVFRAAVLIAGLNPSPILELVDSMELELIEATGSLPRLVSTFELLMTTLPAVALQDENLVNGWQSVLSDDSNRWTSVDGLRGQLAASQQWSMDSQRHQEELDAIAVPVLSIAFEHDLFFPPSNERAAAERISGCEFVVVEGAAHGGLSTHPTVPVRSIVDFCTRQSDGDAAGPLSANEAPTR